MEIKIVLIFILTALAIFVPTFLLGRTVFRKIMAIEDFTNQVLVGFISVCLAAVLAYVLFMVVLLLTMIFSGTRLGC